MIAYTVVERLLIGGAAYLGVCTRCGEQRTGEAGGRDLTRHEWALVITAVVTLAAIAALILVGLGKGWL